MRIPSQGGYRFPAMPAGHSAGGDENEPTDSCADQESAFAATLSDFDAG